jgi:hypothetical protein
MRKLKGEHTAGMVPIITASALLYHPLAVIIITMINLCQGQIKYILFRCTVILQIFFICNKYFYAKYKRTIK